MRSRVPLRGLWAIGALEVLFVAVLGMGPASAVDYQWASPIAGNWSDQTRWLPAGVPASGADSAYVAASGGTYEIDLDANVTLRGLLLANPTTTLNLGGHWLGSGRTIFNRGVIVASPGVSSVLAGNLDNALGGVVRVSPGAVLTVTGNQWRNDGTLDVHPGGTSAAALRIANYLTLDGAGRTVLQDSTLAVIDSPSGFVLTVGAAQTVEGAGVVPVYLVNHGLVRANRAGQPLTLNGINKFNDGTFAATAGGTLRITGITVVNGGGVVRADGGTVCLADAAVSGGDLAATAGSRIVAQRTVQLRDVTQSGELVVVGGSVTSLTGASLAGDGTVRVWDGGEAVALLRIDGYVTTTGGGSIVLGAEGLGGIDSPAGFSLTNGDGRTIRGAGGISAALVNHGVVRADVAGQELILEGASKTNDATMVASDGGRLRIRGTVVNNGGGAIEATGGDVLLENTTISGGTLASGAGHVVRCSGPAVFGDITQTGRLEIASGAVTQLGGTAFVSGGVVHVGSGGGTPALLRIANYVTVSGPGVIELGDPGLSGIDSPAGFTMTQAADHAITGTGGISAPLINHGRISADNAGQALVVESLAATNTGTLAATGGGHLRVSRTALTNGGGTLLADESPVSLESMWINGGTLVTSGAGAITATGTTMASNVRNTGRLDVGDGATLQLAGAVVTNDGVITVHPAGAAASLLRVNDYVTLTGSGRVVLNDAALAGIDSPAGYVLTNGAGHTLAGVGSISAPLTNGGVVTADRPGAVLALVGQAKTNNGTFAAQDGGRLVIAVVPSNYNPASRRLTGGTWIAEDGVLQLTGCPVDTNGATIVLAGSTSAFDRDTGSASALSGLVRNAPDGRLELREGRSFTTSGSFTNAGRLVVGRQSAFSVGGTGFTQTAGGTFEVELAGGGAGDGGVLAVPGQANLAGTLEVSTVGGFVPALGDSFVVMTFGSRSGDFVGDDVVEVAGMYLRRVWRSHSLVLRVFGGVAVPDEPAATLPTEVSFVARRSTGGTPLLVLALPQPSSVDVAVFDVAGRRVAGVTRGAEAAGVHEYAWDGRAADGSRAPSGVYLARARVANPGGTTGLVARVVVVR